MVSPWIQMSANWQASRDLESVTPEAMRQAYEVNCIAPLFLSKAMLPLVENAAGKGAGERSCARSAIIQV